LADIFIGDYYVLQVKSFRTIAWYTQGSPNYHYSQDQELGF